MSFARHILWWNRHVGILSGFLRVVNHISRNRRCPCWDRVHLMKYCVAVLSPSYLDLSRTFYMYSCKTGPHGRADGSWQIMRVLTTHGKRTGCCHSWRMSMTRGPALPLIVSRRRCRIRYSAIWLESGVEQWISTSTKQPDSGIVVGDSWETWCTSTFIGDFLVCRHVLYTL